MAGPDLITVGGFTLGIRERGSLELHEMHEMSWFPARDALARGWAAIMADAVFEGVQ